MKRIINMCLGVVIVFASLLPLSAQERNGFTLGLSSDLFSVPLTEGSNSVRAGSVSVGYGVGKHLHFAVGWENHLLLEPALSGYASKNGLLLEAEYRTESRRYRRRGLGFNVQLVKGGGDFFSVDDYSAGAGMRWYTAGNFFIGSGFRYDNWLPAQPQLQNTTSLNWYWQLGIQISSRKE